MSYETPLLESVSGSFPVPKYHELQSGHYPHSSTYPIAPSVTTPDKKFTRRDSIEFATVSGVIAFWDASSLIRLRSCRRLYSHSGVKVLACIAYPYGHQCPG
jgi:hypothetical protein